MSRGYYTRSVLAAWNWRDGKLTHLWTFDSDDGNEQNRNYRGQGNHNLSVADVDGDGRDEIVYGAMTIDDNGRGLYSAGLGHGDALHVTDLDPDRPGLEVFDIQERFDDAGANFRDARTG
jgi:rhamnogalacturonan endolyase